MGQHEDLLEAALQAVNAVEALSESKLGNADEQELEDLSYSDTLPRFRESVIAPQITRDDEIEIEEDINEITGNEILTTYSMRLSELERKLSDLKEKQESTARQLKFSMQQVEQLTKTKALLESELSKERQAKADLECTLVTEKTSSDEIEQLKKTNGELEEALEKEKKEKAAAEMTAKLNSDRVLRLTADFDNYRKRIARDQERMQQQAEEKIVTALLPVMDNLERALIHSSQTNDYSQLLQGLKMTSKSFLSTLAKFGCLQFKSVGETFNPAFHDVLQRVIDANVPHNSVVQEHLSGYLMNKRVLRPALVVVAQHPEEENTSKPVSKDASSEMTAPESAESNTATVNSSNETCNKDEGDK